jgi:hypothetical protein
MELRCLAFNGKIALARTLAGYRGGKVEGMKGMVFK